MWRDYQNRTKKPLFLNLDADTIGHYLCVLADVHSRLDEKIRNQEFLITEAQLYELYLVGNLEGRLMHNRAIVSDIEMIEAWEKELPKVVDEGVGEF